MGLLTAPKSNELSFMKQSQNCDCFKKLNSFALSVNEVAFVPLRQLSKRDKSYFFVNLPQITSIHTVKKFPFHFDISDSKSIFSELLRG